MENLQELVGQIEEIKDKISDKQYKDILEITKKMNEKKDIGKIIKVKELKFFSIIGYKRKHGGGCFKNVGCMDGFDLENDSDDEDGMDGQWGDYTFVSGRHRLDERIINLEVKEKIYDKDICCEDKYLDRGVADGQIAVKSYEDIKKNITYNWRGIVYVLLED